MPICIQLYVYIFTRNGILLSLLNIKHGDILVGFFGSLVTGFIRPRSDHSLPMSVTHTLTNKLVELNELTLPDGMQNMQNMPNM